MPGKVLKILKNPGDVVAEGESLLVIEAMKMEMQVGATKAGTVVSIDVSVGDQLTNGQDLAHIG